MSNKLNTTSGVPTDTLPHKSKKFDDDDESTYTTTTTGETPIHGGGNAAPTPMKGHLSLGDRLMRKLFPIPPTDPSNVASGARTTQQKAGVAARSNAGANRGRVRGDDESSVDGPVVNALGKHDGVKKDGDAKR